MAPFETRYRRQIITTVEVRGVPITILTDLHAEFGGPGIGSKKKGLLGLFRTLWMS
jgi:hypothetical protein